MALATKTSAGVCPLPLVLRKEDQICLSVYNEQTPSLTEQQISASEQPHYKGDYRECEVKFNPARPSEFAHACVETLRYSAVVSTAPSDGGATTADRVCALTLLFEVPMPHVVVDMQFSPKGTYLVTFAMPDPKRTPDGNLSIFDVATGTLLKRFMQARWPAITWSADEAFLVRTVQGWLHVMPGNIAEAATGSESGGVLSKVDLMVAHDKEVEFSCAPSEARPLVAVFKPFLKNRQATFSVYRLPDLQSSPLYQIQFGRAEAASILWSPSGERVALLVKSERDPSGKSYYGTLTLHLVDVLSRSVKDIKLPGGETVHDCQWAPHADELLVVHGQMPRNKATLFSKHGVALLTFGEAPRNTVAWAPRGDGFMLGGTGNLAGDYQFYSHTPGQAAAAAGGAAARPAASAACTGELNEKCSFQKWAPDSHNFLCSTVFTRLRIDNKLVFTKTNGARVLTEKFGVLYGADWVTLQDPEAYPKRPASPRPTAEEKPKTQAYRAPGGGSRAAALLRRPDSTTDAKAVAAKPAGPVGANVVVQKKKKKR